MHSYQTTDFGNLSAVNQRPFTFEIGIDIMPHERKINHNLSSLTKFLLVQYQLRWFVSSVTTEVFSANVEGSLIHKGNGPGNARKEGCLQVEMWVVFIFSMYFGEDRGHICILYFFHDNIYVCQLRPRGRVLLGGDGGYISFFQYIIVEM